MARIALESFDDETRASSQPPEGFEEGFLQGHAAGLEAAKAAQAALEENLVQCIADLEFKYEEARAEIIRSLTPFFATLVDKILPHCLDKAFAVQIATILEQAVHNNIAGGLSLAVNPGQRQAIASALSRTNLQVALSDEPNLPENAAWIRYDQGEMLIDFDHLLNEIDTILAATEVFETRKDLHG